MQAPHILEQHPGLAQLLADLNTRFLTPTGLSLEYEKDLNQARYSLKNKKSYLESKTVYEPVERLRFLPLDNNIQETNLKGHAADIQRQISDHIDQIITLIEVRSLGLESTLNRRRSQDSSLSRSTYSDHSIVRGLSRSPQQQTRSPGSSKSARQGAANNLLELVTSHTDPDQDQDLDSITMEQLQPHLEALEGFASPMMQTIDRSIQERAQDVTEYFERTFGSKSFTSSSPPTQTLSEVVTTAKNHSIFVNGCREESSVLLEMALYHRCRALFGTLQETVVALWELVIEFKIRHQLEDNQVFRDYFEQVNQALVLKLRISAAMLRQSVYKKETLDALSSLRDALQNQQDALAVQLQQNTELFQRYQNAGDDFNRIVHAYASVLQKIELVQDDIARLK